MFFECRNRFNMRGIHINLYSGLVTVPLEVECFCWPLVNSGCCELAKLNISYTSHNICVLYQLILFMSIARGQFPLTLFLFIHITYPIMSRNFRGN